jgi:hypothetical protein
MSEIIIQINDDVSMDRLMAMLGPYIKDVRVKQSPSGKIWNGKAAWLQHPVTANGFKPLSREEANAR